MRGGTLLLFLASTRKKQNMTVWNLKSSSTIDKSSAVWVSRFDNKKHKGSCSKCSLTQLVSMFVTTSREHRYCFYVTYLEDKKKSQVQVKGKIM